MVKRGLSKVVASLAATGILLCGLSASAVAASDKQSRAGDPTPAYATAVLRKVYDGTGHGTKSQTFVNSDNGFAPGDDTPTDGVVASGDDVGYEIRLDFTAAKKRDVRVEFNFDEAPYLEKVAGGSFCTPGRLVTAKADGDACIYTVPAGAVESITQTVTMRAKDTGGVAQSNQTIYAEVTREGSDVAPVRYKMDPVTVVSAPAADVEVDNGGMQDNYWPSERITSWQDGQRLNGYFDLKVVPLHYEGYSTKGASTIGKWSGVLDVSAFPEGATFQLDGETVTPKNGKITVLLKEGNRRLTWSVPPMKGCEYDDNNQLIVPGGSTEEEYLKTCFANEQDVSYDISLKVDQDSFRAVDEEGKVIAGSAMNMGDGSEQGTQKNGKNDSTADGGLGSISGYPYDNNNWSRGIIHRYTKEIPHEQIYNFYKNLERPYKSGYTRFDDESLTFDAAGGTQTVNHISGTSDEVARNTEVRTILRGIQTQPSSCNETNTSSGGDRDGCSVTFYGSWDKSELQYEDGHFEVSGIDENNSNIAIPGDWVTVEWSPRRVPSSSGTGVPDDGKDWTKVDFTSDASGTVVTQPSIPAEAQSIRVIINPANTGAEELPAGSYYVRFVSKAIGDPTKSGNIIADDYMGGEFAAWGTAYDNDYVNIVAPGKPSASIGYYVNVKDAEGNIKYTTIPGEEGLGTAAQPGDVVNWTSGNSFVINNVQSGKTVLHPTVKVCVSKGTIDPVNDNTQWEMSREDGGEDGCAYTLTFKLKDYKPSYSQDGMATLPEIRWHGTVGNKATGSPTSSISGIVLGDKVGSVPEFTVNTNTATAGYQVSMMAGSAGMVTANQEKVEINDPFSFTWNIYKKNTVIDDDLRTVLVLPNNSDKMLLGDTADDGTPAGPDGSWHEYDLGSSNFHGTYALTEEPTLDAENSTSTKLLYSTDNFLNGSDTQKPLDPDAYEWKTWNEISDKSKITAIEVVSSSENLSDESGSTKLAASRGTLNFQPTGNDEDDQYNLWIGANRVGTKKEEETVPFPARTVVVASSIQGVVWWDDDDNTLQDTDEKVIPGIEVTLYKVGEGTETIPGTDMTGSKITSVKTGEDGSYLFGKLHSGPYMTVVKRSDGTTTNDGVQAKVKTYYNQEKDVENTRSWSGQLHDNAKDESDTIQLGIDYDQTHVDFGYVKPDPKLTVDKTQTSLTCGDDGQCDVSWDVTVENKGNTNIDPSYVLNDRMSASVNNVTATAGTESIEPGGVSHVDTQFNHTVMWGDDGQAYIMGLNSFGQLGLPKETHDVRSPQPIAGSWKQLAAGGNHTIGIHTDGTLWVTGANFMHQLGLESTDNQYGFTQVTVDGSSGSFVSVAAGSDFSVAVDSDGNLWVVGGGSKGYSTWTKVSTNGKALSVDANYANYTVITENGAYYTSSGGNYDLDRLLGVTSSPGVLDASRGNSTNYYITSDGILHGGDDAPQGVTFKSVDATVAINTGNMSTSSSAVAVDSDDNVWVYGENGDGQLATGDTTDVESWRNTGIVASDASVGFQNSVMTSKEVTEYGDDSFGATPTEGSLTGVGLGIKGISEKIDPTAVPVNPVSETTDGSLVTRQYNPPFTVYPGGRVVFHFSGTVAQPESVQVANFPDADSLKAEAGKLSEFSEDGTRNYTASSWSALQTALKGNDRDAIVTALSGLERPFVNQAWVNTSDGDMPYHNATGHVPNAKGDTPDKPDETGARFDSTTHDVTGNTTCVVAADEGIGVDKEHSFADKVEDSCDQSGSTVPARTGDVVLGSISGLYWLDANKNGIQDADETQHFAGQKVYLYDAVTEKQLAETTTDENGAYLFDELPMGNYTVSFSRVTDEDGKGYLFTVSDKGDTTPATDGASNDSDANNGYVNGDAQYGDPVKGSPDSDDYGFSTAINITLTTGNAVKEHIDAGVYPEVTLLDMLPGTGGKSSYVSVIVALAVVLLGAGAVTVAVRRR